MYYDDYTDYGYYNYQTNKDILEAQLQTNQQLRQLRSQIEQGNLVNQQILQNQIRDIEERETQKFYKNRAFKINQLINSINNCQEVDKKALLYSFLGDAITGNISEAAGILNEISDKEYCSKMLDDFSKNQNDFFNTNSISIGEELSAIKSGRNEYVSLKQEIENLDNQCYKLKNEPEVKPQTTDYGILPVYIGGGITLLSLIILSIGLGFSTALVISSIPLALTLIYYYGFNEKPNENVSATLTNEERKRKIDNIVSLLVYNKSRLENCQYTQAINSLTNKFPSWNSVLTENRRYLAE